MGATLTGGLRGGKHHTLLYAGGFHGGEALSPGGSEFCAQVPGFRSLIAPAGKDFVSHLLWRGIQFGDERM